jgi:hypothetical protein
MAGFEAFLTGFLGRTTDIIGERKDKAENYFDQSIERARTVGQDQLRQRVDNQQAMLSVANNLINQAGMPEDLVRVIANDGPAALEQAYQIYATNAEAGVQVDEGFWRNVYDFSTEMTQGSDMTLEDFLGQVNGLYGSNLSATTREGGDPFGAFIASGLGLNAMERAQGRLEDYQIGGYSAADLLAMEARPSSTSPLGSTNFGGPDIAVATPRREDVYDPTPEERIRFVDNFNEAVDAETQQLFDEYSAGVSTSGETANKTLEDFRQQAAQNIATAYASTVGVDVIQAYPEIAIHLGDEWYEEEEPVVEEPSPVVTDDALPPPSVVIGDEGATPPPAPEPVAPSAPEPAAFDPSEGDLVLEDGTTAKYVGTTPSGKIRYQMEDGSYVEGTREEIEEIIQSGGAQRMPSLGLGGMDTSVPLNEE